QHDVGRVGPAGITVGDGNQLIGSTTWTGLSPDRGTGVTFAVPCVRLTAIALPGLLLPRMPGSSGWADCFVEQLVVPVNFDPGSSQERSDALGVGPIDYEPLHGGAALRLQGLWEVGDQGSELRIAHIGPVLVFVPVMPVIALGRGPVPGLTFSILEVVRAVFVILFLILLCLFGEVLVGRVERPGSGPVREPVVEICERPVAVEESGCFRPVECKFAFQQNGPGGD